MENLLLIAICLIAGLSLQKVREFPENGYRALNFYVLYVALPAMTLFYIPKIKIGSELLLPLGISWISFALSFLFFYFLGKRFNWSKALTGCLILTAGLGNTSFIGFPVIKALYGESGLKTAIIVDQPGSFVVMSTVGIIVAAIFSGSQIKKSAIVGKILLFPPFAAFLLSASLNIFHTDFSATIQSLLHTLGNTVVPVALVSVGLQLKFNLEKEDVRMLSLGLLFKLLITPLFFVIFYKIILGTIGLESDVSVLESAMPPMIAGVILASNYNLRPKLAGMMAGIGIPLSFLTIAFWYKIIEYFF